MTNQIISQILLYLADFSKFAQKLTGNINISSLHYDWLIVFFFIFSVIIIALSLGRSRMLVALLSLYIAAFLEPHFVYFEELKKVLNNKPDYWLHIGLFFLLYIIVFTILNRSILKHRLTLIESSIFPLIIIAILEMGFLATILFSYFPSELNQKLSPKLIPYFATKSAQFWWALTPLFAIFFSKKKKEIHSI